MMKILFRVNSSTEVGMGHLMRCLTLADHLKESYNTENIFWINDFPEGIKRVSNKGYQLIKLDHLLDIVSQLNFLREYFKKHPIDLFIVDINHPNKKYMTFFKQNGRVAYFYDINVFKTYDADLVMNHHICLKDLVPKDDKKEYLFGPKYFIFPPFSKNKINDSNKKNCIFINQGGGDPFNLTCKILHAIKSLKGSFCLKIVIGGAFKKNYKKELDKLLENYQIPYKLYENIEHSQMFSLMKDCCLAITAAGNTLYELSFIGIPSVVISHHKNHDNVAREYEKSKACINLGIGKEIDEKKIQSVIETILPDLTKRNTLSTQAQKLVDGLGLERVGRAINNLCIN